ncbi:MAG: ATP-binding protein [Burkholderiaceae bacterium]
MNPSIQRRLSLWLSFVILVAGIMAAATSFFVAYHDATLSQDAQLTQVASALSRGSYRDVPPESDAANAQESEDRFVVVPLGLQAEPGLSAAKLALPMEIKDGLQTVRANDAEWRVIVIRDSSGERFGVAQSMDARNEDAKDGALYILVPIAFLIPLLLVAVHFILRALFSPLAALSREMDQVDGATLKDFQFDRVPSELIPFVDAVNRLLKRLALALEQQGRFVAHAAHELRSPVAALMVQAENVQNISISSDARDRVSQLRRGLQRMAALQDQLLSLARMQAIPASAHVLDFDQLVRTTIEDLLAMAAAKTIDLGCTHLESVRILGDPTHATSLIRNSIDNAIRYTPTGGSVDVSITREGRVACFVIQDTGPGIRAADVPMVFEPFVRILGTRETGSGLGLAIVRAAANALGGTVELTTRLDRRSGLRFVYRQAAV